MRKQQYDQDAKEWKPMWGEKALVRNIRTSAGLTGFHTLSQDRGTPSRICLSQSQDCGMMLENVDDT